MIKTPSVVINVSTTRREQPMERYVIDEIRKRVDAACLQTVITPQSILVIEATIRSVLKESEQAGIIHRLLTEQDVRGIVEVMLLEWNAPNFYGPRVYDFQGYTIPVSAPDVRDICGALSDQAVKAMAAPHEDLVACRNTARFFFLEKLRRDGAIKDWSFLWTDPTTRSGEVFITLKHDIKYVSVGLVDDADP